MNSRKTLTGWFCLLASLVGAGCDSGSRDRKSLSSLSEPPRPMAGVVSGEKLDEMRGRKKGGATKPGDNKAPDNTKPAEADNAPIPPLDIEAAAREANKGKAPSELGAPLGSQPKDLGGGYLGATFNAYFGAKEQVALFRIKQALGLYKAEHKSYPKSLPDFMKEIIEPNGIKLPALPMGKEYRYNPDSGELHVWPDDK